MICLSNQIFYKTLGLSIKSQCFFEDLSPSGVRSKMSILFKPFVRCDLLYEMVKFRHKYLGGGKKMNKIMMDLWNDESGQGMAEYGLILALVAVVAIAGFRLLGSGVSKQINAVGTEIYNTNP